MLSVLKQSLWGDALNRIFEVANSNATKKMYNMQIKHCIILSGIISAVRLFTSFKPDFESH